jgi:methylglyoxal synthase
MKRNKRIALVAHDNRKQDLVEWVEWNWEELVNHELICTGTTGAMVEDALINKLTADKRASLKMTKLKSGPLGGDQQLGAMICEGKVDMLIFLWDPMQPQPHDVDVKALLRIAVLYNIPTANNRATADFMISSILMKAHYTPIVKDYTEYIKRMVKS